MTTLTSRLSIALGIVIVAVGAFFYHQYVVSSLESELANLKTAYAQAQAQALESAMAINKEVLEEREETYAEIYDAGKTAAVTIATAESKPGDVDLDGLLPADVSDALSLQYERIYPSSVSNISP